MSIIEVEHLSKIYKNGVEAIKNMSFSVEQGEIFTLLGKNGAGKSTLIHILTTFLAPSSGNVILLGEKLENNAAQIRQQIACVAQKISIDQYLTLEQNMLFQSRLYGISKIEARERMENLIQCFELDSYRKYPVSTYSGGVKRRLDIALNLMSNPKIIFFDEPTVGMDLHSRIAMWNMIKQMKETFGTTIFLTTHYLEEADQLSDSICIMKDGTNMVQGNTRELRGYLNREKIAIKFDTANEAKNQLGILQKTFAQDNLYLEKETIVFGNHTMEQRNVINRFLLEQEIPFRGIELVQPTLEDVFIRFTEETKGEN